MIINLIEKNMATDKSTVDYIIDQISRAGSIRAKKMFGEYGLYCNEVFIALVCDDQLFVKPTAKGKQLLEDYREGIPYPNAKPHLLIDGDLLENHELVTELIRRTVAELQTQVKPKKVKHDE